MSGASLVDNHYILLHGIRIWNQLGTGRYSNANHTQIIIHSISELSAYYFTFGKTFQKNKKENILWTVKLSPEMCQTNELIENGLHNRKSVLSRFPSYAIGF